MTMYLPIQEWPEADRIALQRAFNPRGRFDKSKGRGDHLAPSTRKALVLAYRRWLWFLQTTYPDALAMQPGDRVTRERVEAFVDHFGPSVRAITPATAVEKLHYALHLIAPEVDCGWLKKAANRLRSGSHAIDRFNNLVRAHRTLDYGIELMEAALTMPATPHRDREIQFRDGLLIALLSVWPIRRRSLAALTVTDHVERHDDGVDLVLHPEDTKGGREESFRLPDMLVPYFRRYIEVIRPRLLIGDHRHDHLWLSFRGTPLGDSSIYLRVSKLIFQKFGKRMNVHDFRRAAATFFAIDAPEMIGIIPGALQHASPEVAEQHYNLARGAAASRRFAAFQKVQKARLRRPAGDRRNG